MTRLISFLLVLSAAVLAGPALLAQEPGEGLPSGHAASGLPDAWVGPGPLHKVIVRGSDAATHQKISSSGAVDRRIDYGSYTLYVVDERRLGGHEGLIESGFPVRDEHDLIALSGFIVDGTHPEAALASLRPEQSLSRAFESGLPRDAGLYLVQFEGPIRDEWLTELTDTGAELVQFMPMNAWIVRMRPDDVAAFEGSRYDGDPIQFASPYNPAWRMAPEVRALAEAGAIEAVRATIQLVRRPGIADTIGYVEGLAQELVLRADVGPYTNLRLDISPRHFLTLAAHPDVFAIELWGELIRLDEVQGQTVAGNVLGATPTGPGYLAWLMAHGFSGVGGQFQSFAVNVVDDCPNLNGHPDLGSARIAFNNNPTGQGSSQGGHGFLNSHIVGGFNDQQTGFPAEDPAGFQYGLGIAPFAQVGVTAIFGGGALNPTALEAAAYLQGSRISTNSWGFQQGGGPVADYNSIAQEYDFIVRDARSGDIGNQELTVAFAAGNFGSGSNTVSTPATAKNIITVGASENPRPNGTDGCGVGNGGADDVRDIIGFSSRGPVSASSGDGRWKPEIVAPGTHVEAGVPQSNYNGSSVCNAFFPSGQTLYGWSSGTSHSCPAVAGGAALVRQWFLNQGFGAPSPAMVKAFLANSCEYMTGTGANDTLPSNSQGMGRMHLGRAFDTVAREVVDQSVVLGFSGDTFQINGNVLDNSRPFRVTLCWTDAPGPTTGAPFVNNLDLEVTVGANTYLGNVFSGATSTPGGTADIRNNTESVFLPAGLIGPYTVTVRGTSIGADGVPGNADITDQDFALIISNGDNGGAPTANFFAAPLAGEAPLAVQFTDQSFGNVTSRSWDFGDGNMSTLANPMHTYNQAGLFTVTLTVTGPGGTDARTRVDYIDVTPPPAFLINLPNGVPSAIVPDQTTPLLVTTTDIAGSPDPTTAQLFSSIDGGPFTASAMTFMGNDTYTADLPAAPCFSSIRFYIAIDPIGGGPTMTEPRDAPATTLGTVAEDPVLQILFDDDFETNQGWTVTNDAALTDGAWQRAVPVGGGDRGDPAADFDGSGQCYVTDAADGNSDVDGGSTTLTSPVFDLQTFGDARLSFAFWYDNEFGGNPNSDTFEMEITDNGTTWTTVESYNDNANAWLQRQVRVTDFVTASATVQMRFIASDPAPNGSVVEAGVDAFRVEVCTPTGLLGPCATGRVGVAAGVGPVDVLLINGSAGGAQRRVHVPMGSTYTLTMADPPMSTGENFLIYAYIGIPTPQDVFPISPAIGDLCFPPCAVEPTNPRLLVVTNNFTADPCGQAIPSTPSPFTVVGQAVNFPITVTLQGIIREFAFFSTTNAVIFDNQP